MKTHIIRLEPFDDITSVRDRMAWGKTARILIVWPDKDDRILNRRLDLVLLKRRADELGSQLAVVARDSDVRFYARELAIPVFGSVAQAQSSRWLLRRQESASHELDVLPIRTDPRGQRPATRRRQTAPLLLRLLALLSGVLAVAALAGVLLPSAAISLVPETRSQTVSFTAVTGPGIPVINASGAVPARSLSVIVEGSRSVEATGSVQVPDSPAQGFVLFSNLTTEAVQVSQGSVVLTAGPNPVRYLVTRSGTLDAEPGATVLLPVTAVLPGEAGNAPAGAVTAVEGVLGLQVTVTNPESFAGGSDDTLTAPTESDRARAALELTEALEATALDELLTQITEDDLLLTPEPVIVQTLQETSQPEDDTPADFVEVTLRLEFELRVVRRADIEQLAGLVLDAGLPPGFEPLGAEVRIEFLSDPEIDEAGAAEWDMTVQRAVRSTPDASALLPGLLGEKPEAARAVLENGLDLGSPPEIRLSPAWWPRLPLLPIQIDISVGG